MILRHFEVKIKVFENPNWVAFYQIQVFVNQIQDVFERIEYILRSKLRHFESDFETLWGEDQSVWESELSCFWTTLNQKVSYHSRINALYQNGLRFIYKIIINNNKWVV